MSKEYIIGYHLHKCGVCGLVWKHGDDKHGDDEAHCCPECGEYEFEKHKWCEKWSAADKALLPVELQKENDHVVR